MKTARVIGTFKKLMVNLGYKDIEVKPANPEDHDYNGDYLVGFNTPHGFNADVDIVPGEITVQRRWPLKKRTRSVKVQGFIITGYKQTMGNREEPPDVVDFEIGTSERLEDAFNKVINFYVQEQINNAWEAAYFDELAEDEKLDIS